MFIKYDEYELLELFESEPIVISEKDAGMFIYTKNNRNSDEIEITLCISVYEKECTILLSYKEHVFFESLIKNVKCIETTSDCLCIKQSDVDNKHLIYFKPNIFVKLEL